MSDTNPGRSAGSMSSVVVVCFTLVTVAIIGAIVSVALGTGDEGRAATVLTILAGILATTVSAFSTLFGVRDVNRKVDKVLNGVMDEKIQRNVITALDQHAAVIIDATTSTPPAHKPKVAPRTD